MNRAQRRRSRIASYNEPIIKALDKHAKAWIEQKMLDPAGCTLTAQELAEQYWLSLKNKDMEN